jgi:hypothetical protein
MRQEVNLLNLEPVVKPPTVSFNVLLVSVVVCLITLNIVGFSQDKALVIVNEDIATIEKNNIFLQKNTIDFNDINKFQNKLSGLEKQLLSRYQLWSNYKNITNSGKEGFSQYFYYIATLADANLSLYEINVYDRGASLALKGYSKKAEYIPVYINDLKSQSELKSVSFGDLSIEKIDGHDILRFSLDRKKEEDSDNSQSDRDKKIDISEILKMSLTKVEVRSSSNSMTSMNTQVINGVDNFISSVN